MPRINRPLLLTIVLILATLACSTRTPPMTPELPGEATKAAPTPEVTATMEAPPTPEPTTEPTPMPPAYRYDIVLVAEGMSATAYTEAGAVLSVAGTIPANSVGLVPTGRTSTIGIETWVEIQLPGNGPAWLPRLALTEHIDSAAFCADDRVPMLFANLLAALESNDGRILSPIVSPVHGLAVVYLHGGIPRVFTPEQAGLMLGTLEIVNWGNGPASGLPVEGSFAELVRPDLLTVLQAEYEAHCEEITLGGASYEVTWPFEWQNIRYYSLYKPGSADQELDWMTWLAGVEYVDGAPYLYSLSRYNWEP